MHNVRRATSPQPPSTTGSSPDTGETVRASLHAGVPEGLGGGATHATASGPGTPAPVRNALPEIGRDSPPVGGLPTPSNDKALTEPPPGTTSANAGDLSAFDFSDMRRQMRAIQKAHGRSFRGTPLRRSRSPSKERILLGPGLSVSRETVNTTGYEIHTQGLMHVISGSKPMYLLSTTSERPLTAALDDLVKTAKMNEAFAYVAPDAGHRYLVNRDNLGKMVSRHDATLRQWLKEDWARQVVNPSIQKGYLHRAKQLDGIPAGAEATTAFLMDTLRTSELLSDRVLGVMFGYGVKNSENYRRLQSEPLSAETMQLTAQRDHSATKASIDKLFGDRWQHGHELKRPGPPMFAMWDDTGPDDVETSTLVQRYLDESEHMANTVLKTAYTGAGDFNTEASRAFFSALFEPASH